MSIPDKIKEYLSKDELEICDAWCGEPIMWGHKIIKHAGEQMWQEINKHGKTHCVYPDWYLITKTLTRKEAIEKYGEITNEEYGSRGGWRSATFGDKKFTSRIMKEIYNE